FAAPRYHQVQRLAVLSLGADVPRPPPPALVPYTTLFRSQLPDGESRRYILQKINTATFTDPDGLMENICGVTEYLRKQAAERGEDRKSTRLNSSHVSISYAAFCLRTKTASDARPWVRGSR